MKAREATADAVALLLKLGWKQVAEDAKGQLWAKGQAQTSFSVNMMRPGVAWSNFLVGLSSVEGRTPADLERLVAAEKKSRASRKKSSKLATTRAELDLHILPPDGDEHETDAWNYGGFVRATADAVNELVKNYFGVKRHRRNLQVFAGATQGSVRVQLREPHEIPNADEPLFADGNEPPERKGLIILAQLLNTAEEASKRPQDSTLDGQLQVGVNARRALVRLAGTAAESGWTMKGELLLPNTEPLAVRLTPAGAHRLQWAAREAQESTTTETKRGTLDGWLWGEAEMHLKTETGIIRAAVPLAHQEQVAQLNTDPTRQVTAVFSVLERLASDGSLLSRARVLISIEADPELTELPEGEA